MPSDRSVRRQLQAVFAEVGVVLERVEQTDAQRPYAGWWIQPTIDHGDDCPACVAARNGRAMYVGYHSRQAIQTAVRIQARHHHNGAGAAA